MGTYDRYLLSGIAGFRAIGLAILCAATAVRAQNVTSQPSAAQTVNTPTAFHEEVIVQMTPNSEYKDGLVGDNHIAWVEQRGGKRTVMLDGKQQGGDFEDIKWLTFSSDESRFAFTGKRSGSWIFVLDGQEHSAKYKTITFLSFQPAGNSYAYGACQDKKCGLAVDGAKIGAEYDDITYPEYSRDGKRIAFLAKREKKWIAVVDGKELAPEVDAVANYWGFTHNGGRFYMAGRIRGGWTYFVDSMPGPTFEVLSPISFSDDGKRYAYSGTNAKGGLVKQKTLGTLVVDGQSVATFEGRGMGGGYLSATTEYLIPGVNELPTDFSGISTPQFNPDGKLVYAARRAKGDVAVFVGDNAGPGFDEILSGVVFSRDSGHFAYVAKRGSDFVTVVDNHPGLTFTPSKHGATEVPWIEITSDGKHLVFETVSGGQLFKSGTTIRALRSLVFDGQAGEEYDAMALKRFIFEKDDRHYSYIVLGTREGDLVNVDGHQSRPYNDVTNNHFSDDGKSVQFVARDAGRFLRVTYELGPGNSQLSPAQTTPP